MRKSLCAFTLILLLAIFLGACSTQEARQPVAALSVEMNEFKFEPSTMTVLAGKEISLALKNTGAVEHDFTILKKGQQASVPFDRDKQAADILADYKLAANQTGNYKFTPPEAGEYIVVCSIQGHLESGMSAKITALKP